MLGHSGPHPPPNCIVGYSTGGGFNQRKKPLFNPRYLSAHARQGQRRIAIKEIDMTARVNRYLKDKDMDNIDHALGRPVDPTGETCRNYFATTEPEFSGNPHWDLTGKQGDMFFYSVSELGRAALRDHLDEIGDKHRSFIVSIDGVDMNSRAATNHSKARYAAYLDYSDCYEITFGEFQKLARVRLAEATQ